MKFSCPCPECKPSHNVSLAHLLFSLTSFHYWLLLHSCQKCLCTFTHALSWQGKLSHPPNQVPTHPTWPKSMIFWSHLSTTQRINHSQLCLTSVFHISIIIFTLILSLSFCILVFTKAGFHKLQVAPNLDPPQDIKTRPGIQSWGLQSYKGDWMFILYMSPKLDEVRALLGK